MGIIHKFVTAANLIKDSDARFLYLANSGFYKNMDDTSYLKRMFRAKLKYDLNLDDPKSFNEKLQWLKIHDRRPLYTTMVDKYNAKKYVSSIIGSDYIIPTLGVWDDPDSFDFSDLPERFVLKTTHDSGGIKIVNVNDDTFDEDKLKAYFRKRINRSLYYITREWPYKDVKPRIIAEQYIDSFDKSSLNDYKFFCFNGKVKFFKVDYDRFVNHRANYYDIDGKLLSFGEVNFPSDPTKKLMISHSDILKMVELSEMLSCNIPFIRVDFYNVNGNIYWGELTLYPASGFGCLYPQDADASLGRMITLPK